jgi:hypothetical protein
MSVPYHPLGYIREAVAELGLEVTYVFEDLVLIQHNAFLLQMGARGEDVALYFNIESLEDERDSMLAKLQQAGRQRQLCIEAEGTFSMNQKPDEQIGIEFFTDKEVP